MKSTAIKAMRALLVCLAFVSFFSPRLFGHSPRPLSRSDLLALVAGDILPENVAFDIQSRGLDFVPDDSYKSLLKSAGADPKVLSALNAAKNLQAETTSPADAQLLQHLSHAGSLIKAGKLDDAADELTDTLSNSSHKSEIGFVMGLVLLEQQRYPEATQVYSQILFEDPGFPEVHARLSATYYNGGDFEEALRQAKAGLADNPNNPAAHVNEALSFQRLQRFDASKEAYQKAIRCKPDYEPAYSGLGSLLDDLKDFNGAIENYKKALTLNPRDVRTRYNLGVVYGEKGDLQAAIREYREVKRLDPHKLDARQNLSSALMEIDPAAAITELRELASIAPDWPLCHVCLGNALTSTGRYEEAEKEFAIAVKQDPASPSAFYGLGRNYETEKKLDEALAAYRKGEALDASDAHCFTAAGRVLTYKRDFAAAIVDLKHAVEVDPAEWYNHALLGEAVEGSGDRKTAIAEYKEAITLAPKQLQARLDLARALEKIGDWVAALQNFHQAAIDETPPKANGIGQFYFDASNQYKSAQQRFQQHLADLRSAGKTSEADVLEARLKENAAAPNIGENFHRAMQASQQAVTEKRFDDAETSAKEAIVAAEKMQPQDGRVAEALGQLGNVYAWRAQYAPAETAYKRQLAFCQRLYGADSPMLAAPLQNLGMTAAMQNNLSSAEIYLSRALEVDLKAYGENSNETATALSGAARIYLMEKKFSMAESALVRALKAFETMYGQTDYRLALPVSSLCALYDQTGDSDKSVSCHARMVSLEEKQFGESSPFLTRDLTAEAQALRKLGRDQEAGKLEHRAQALQSAQAANPN